SWRARRRGRPRRPTRPRARGATRSTDRCRSRRRARATACPGVRGCWGPCPRTLGRRRQGGAREPVDGREVGHGIATETSRLVHRLAERDHGGQPPTLRSVERGERLRLAADGERGEDTAETLEPGGEQEIATEGIDGGSGDQAVAVELGVHGREL